MMARVSGSFNRKLAPAPTVERISMRPADTREPAAMELALETVREPFDLEHGPVMRARLVQLAAEDFLFCLAMHHVISDGFTGSILLDELGAIDRKSTRLNSSHLGISY